jgi:hypothetical protein
MLPLTNSSFLVTSFSSFLSHFFNIVFEQVMMDIFMASRCVLGGFLCSYLIFYYDTIFIS